METSKTQICTPRENPWPVREVYIVDRCRQATLIRLQPASGAAPGGHPPVTNLRCLLDRLYKHRDATASEPSVPCTPDVIAAFRTAALRAGVRRVVLPCPNGGTAIRANPLGIAFLRSLEEDEDGNPPAA